jgi:hypothetical protein
MPQATRPLAQTPTSPSKFIVPNPPTNASTTLVPVAVTSHPPQIPGATTHLASSVTPTHALAGPSAPTASLTDEGTALIFRLVNYHVPPTDISRVVAILNGRDQTTVEEAQLLRRLNNLNVSVEDTNLIIDAMQRRDRSDGGTAPPGYGS